MLSAAFLALSAWLTMLPGAFPVFAKFAARLALGWSRIVDGFKVRLGLYTDHFARFVVEPTRAISSHPHFPVFVLIALLALVWSHNCLLVADLREERWEHERSKLYLESEIRSLSRRTKHTRRTDSIESMPSLTRSSTESGISSVGDNGPVTPPDSPRFRFFSFGKRQGSKVGDGNANTTANYNTIVAAPRQDLAPVTPKLLEGATTTTTTTTTTAATLAPFQLPRAPFQDQFALRPGCSDAIIAAHAKEERIWFHDDDKLSATYQQITSVCIPVGRLMSLSDQPFRYIYNDPVLLIQTYSATPLSVSLFMDLLFERPVDWEGLFGSLTYIHPERRTIALRGWRTREEEHPLLGLVQHLEFIRAKTLANAIEERVVQVWEAMG